MINESQKSLSVSHNLWVVQETEGRIPEKWSLLDRNTYEHIFNNTKQYLCQYHQPVHQHKQLKSKLPAT